jgi:hypothetical protein
MERAISANHTAADLTLQYDFDWLDHRALAARQRHRFLMLDPRPPLARRPETGSGSARLGPGEGR